MNGMAFAVIESQDSGDTMQSKEVTGRATGVRRGKGAQQAVETSKRERVLDVAERLFAEGGFDGVSMRDIASAAEVGLPLIVYHFETKMGLYRALFERRKTVLDTRLALLREPVAEGEDPLEHIVRAFVLPVMQIQNTESGLAYAKLVAREASDPREAERGIVAQYHARPSAASLLNISIRLRRNSSRKSGERCQAIAPTMRTGPTCSRWARW